MITIDSISVCKDFQERGYTTAGAFTHFDDMAKDGITKIVVSNENKERLRQILNRAEKKKHRQTKFGGGIIFCYVYFLGGNTYHRVIISNVEPVYNIFGSIKDKRLLIIDLTKMTSYKITNYEDLKWLNDFTEQVKSY